MDEQLPVLPGVECSKARQVLDLCAAHKFYAYPCPIYPDGDEQ